MTFQSFLSTSVEQSKAISDEAFRESAIRPIGRVSAAFRSDIRYGVAGSMTFGAIECNTELSITLGLDLNYLAIVPVRGSLPMTFGRDVLVADRFTAGLVGPETVVATEAFHTGDEHFFVLSFEEGVFNGHLAALLGRDRIDSFAFEPRLDLRSGGGAQWWRLTSALALDLQSPGGIATNPLMAASLTSAVMTGMLLVGDHPYRDELAAQTRPIPPASVRKAREIIESRAHGPLTIPEIAAEIGCGVRALQTAYRKHLDMTPQEHIKRVRLDRARFLLRLANPGATTVAEVAAKVGYAQPGRFATDYRKVYGVSPSVTLREW